MSKVNKQVEGENAEATEVAEEVEETETGAEEVSEEVTAQAKELADSIVKGVAAQFGNANSEAVAEQVNRMMSRHLPTDAKLTKILGGKDMFTDASSLTKEEKIVGFFHALVTRNHYALKALAEGVAADGGYLFPNEFLGELVRHLPEENVMRNLVRVIPMKRDVMDISTLVSGPKVFWTAENATKSTTSAHFGTDTLTARKVAAILYSSDELIEDSDIFDVVQLIISLFGEEIGQEEEKVIWSGNNTTQPEGIDAAGTVASIAAVGQDFDDLVRLQYALPRRYRANATFVMNSEDAQEISLLKDSNGQYLWRPSREAGSPDQLLGKPVVICDHVPLGKIYYGDFKRAYFLGDRKRMTVKVSQETETAFTKDQTAIRVVARIGGALVLPAALRVLTGFSA